MPRLCTCEPKRFKLCQERIATSGLAPPGTHPDNMICGYNPGEYEHFSGESSSDVDPAFVASMWGERCRSCDWWEPAMGCAYACICEEECRLCYDPRKVPLRILRQATLEVG